MSDAPLARDGALMEAIVPLAQLQPRAILSVIVAGAALTAALLLGVALFAPPLGLAAEWAGILIGGATFAPVILVPGYFLLVGYRGRRWRSANDN